MSDISLEAVNPDFKENWQNNPPAMLSLILTPERPECCQNYCSLGAYKLPRNKCLGLNK